MEKIEVEVFSRETIKPSSPTPDDLRHYQLSFLDQISPSVYNPSVLFFSNEAISKAKLDPADISTRLKSSLSETLTRYYPLAGRITDNLFINCNDEGIPYSETRVRCRLSDVLQNLDLAEFRKFIPFALNGVDDVIFGVQFNVFECGGIAVGLCLSHRVADGLSVFVFLRAWAAICRGEMNVVVSPEFVSAKLFPPKKATGFDPTIGIVTENIVSKRFIIRSDMINLLKEKYGKGIDLDSQRPPSRVEALSAFMWSRYTSSTQVLSQPGKLCFIVHAVNLRAKFDPPLPEQSFGNLYRIAITFASPNLEEEGCDDLIPRMRQTIADIDKEYIEKLRQGDEHMSLINDASEMFHKGKLICFSFTSLCNFPLYEADFGWGKPMWISTPSLTFKNLVIFKDSKSGDGVEVYISLSEEDMAKFENDEELLKYIEPIASDISK